MLLQWGGNHTVQGAKLLFLLMQCVSFVYNKCSKLHSGLQTNLFIRMKDQVSSTYFVPKNDCNDWSVKYISWWILCLLDHLDSWVKRDQLDATCFIISLFNAQHVSDVNTSILRSLRLICRVISWVVLLWFDVCWCYVVVWLWWCGIGMQAEAHSEITQQISRKLLRMDVLTSETCWALNKEIIKQVASSWSLFTPIYHGFKHLKFVRVTAERLSGMFQG